MSKVAEYLQEHILGEVTTSPAVLEAMAKDGSILQITPEMVAYPSVTSDIRKIARFAWQLAEKGHVLPITPRGHGTDETGAAIGKGVALVLPAHMNMLLEFDPKQKLVRVQPGMNAKALADSLSLHGLAIPALPLSAGYSTVGGAAANNAVSPLTGSYGTMREWTHQLEVVLANGEVLQTERLSKRDLNKRKGIQNFEGEIYRNLDNLIEDNQELIADKIGADTPDACGYSAIAKVKQKDGSFDLTPLFVGSQGTLGIISEMILKTDYLKLNSGCVVAGFTDQETARDALDQLRTFEPASLDYYDGELFQVAANRSKSYEILRGVNGPTAAVVVMGFSDFNDRVRSKKMKRTVKYLDKLGVFYEAAEGDDVASLMAVSAATSFLVTPNEKGVSAPPLMDGAYVAPERFEEFLTAVKTLADKYGVILPIHYKALENTVFTRPMLQFHKVSDKQKIFKLLDEYGALIAYFGGFLVSQNGEGRVKSRFAYAQLDDDITALYAAIKSIFDPYGILNPGVKQNVELRTLVSQLRRDYDSTRFADYSPCN